MTSKLLPQPPAHGPLGRTRPQEFSLGHGHCSPLPLPEGAPTCPAPVTACQGPSACSKPFPCVEVGFVCSVQACAAASAGVSGLGPPPPSLSRHWHRLTRLEGQGEIWGPVPQQGHLEKQAALSFLPRQPLPPAFPGASIISWRKLCSNESYLSPSPSREHGAHSWDQETDRRDGEQGAEHLSASGRHSLSPPPHSRPGTSRPPSKPARPCAQGSGRPVPVPPPPCPMPSTLPSCPCVSPVTYL